MASLDLTMVLKLNDRASKKMQAFNRVLDRTAKKLERIGKLQAKNNASSKRGGSGGSGGGVGAGGGLSSLGLAAGAGVATSAVSGTSKIAEGLKKLNVVSAKAAEKTKVLDDSFIRIKDAIKAFRNKIPITEKSLAEFGKRAAAVDPQLKAVEKQLGRTGKAAKKAGTDATSGAKGWRKYATAIKAAIGVGAFITLKNMIQTGIELEKLRATLSAVIPEGDNVGEAFAFIQKIAEKLPSSIQEVTTAFIRMQALGLAPTEEKLLSFGNTAAASGKSVLQFVEAVADAVVGENERLKEFGIKAKVSGDKVAFTFRNVTTEVDKTSLAISKYLVEIGKSGAFAGAAEKQMGTLDGQISNLGVTWDKLSDILTDTFNPAMSFFIGLAESGVSLLSIIVIGLRKEIVALTGAFTELFIFVGSRFERLGKSAADKLLVDKKRDAAIAQSRKIYQGMLDELDAQLDQDAAAKKYSKTLDDRAKAQEKDNKAKKDSTILIQAEILKLQTLGEFVQETMDNSAVQEQQLQNAIASRKIFNQLLEDGIITEAQYNRSIKQIDDIINKTDEMSVFMEQAFRNMQGDLANFFTDAVTKQFSSFSDGMKQLGADFARTINRMVAQWFAAKVLTGGFGLFGFDTSAQTRGFADGGRPPLNVPSIVGERGPELFVPDSAGTIVPNEQMGGKTVQINITAMDSQDVMRSLEQNKRGITEMVFGTQQTFNMGIA